MLKLIAHSVVALFALACICLLSGSARAQTGLQVFGGYSYLRPNIDAQEAFTCPPGALCPPIAARPPIFTSSRQNLNGWEVAAAARVVPFLRIAADVSAQYGSTIGSGSSKTHQYSYLIGPEISLPGRVSPFAHVFVGGAHQLQDFGTFPINSAGYNSVLAADHWGFATAIGGGIDVKLIPHIWVRPIQFDYVATRLNGGTQNQPKIAAGVVLRF